MKVAIVLPPREMFSARATGAVGLLVHGLAREGQSTVYGMPAAAPFDDVPFRPVASKWRIAPQAVRYAAGLAALLKVDRPDLIEVHNRPDIALYLTARLEVPVILFLHNDPQGMRKARSPVERTLLLRALAVVAPVSDYLRSRLTEGVTDLAQPIVFPNFIDLKAIPPPAPEQLVLFAGRVVADKGADAFVAACAIALPQLRDWRAEIVGADRFGADSPLTPFLAALKPKAEAAGVAMRGWQPHAEVLATMARAAITVVPSRWAEPFGLTALEAMACGSALLCAPRGGLVEVMGDAAVAIDADNPEGIAAAIVALAQNPARRAEVATAGLARAQGFSAGAARARLAALRAKTLADWAARRSHPI